MVEKISITITSKYHRDQFDDWLASGSVEQKGKTHSWSAHDANYGFGWEIEPISEDDWNDISEDEVSKITTLIKKCLYEHRIEYVF